MFAIRNGVATGFILGAIKSWEKPLLMRGVCLQKFHEGKKAIGPAVSMYRRPFFVAAMEGSRDDMQWVKWPSNVSGHL